MDIFVCCHTKMAAYERHVEHKCQKNMFLVFVLLLQLSAVFGNAHDSILRRKRAAINQNGMAAQDMLEKMAPVNSQVLGQRGEIGLKGIQADGMKKLQPNNMALPIKHDALLNSQGNPVDIHQRNLGAPPEQKTIRKGPQFMLVESPECQEDLARHCNIALGSKRHNFAILECLQSDAEVKLSEGCQHLIYMYKRNLTKDGRFEAAGKEVCGQALKVHSECKREIPENRIPCLIEYMDNITEPSCQQFLNKMAGIIFSDYRYVYHFMQACEDDITKFECGRMDNDKEKEHEQGKTIVCLAGMIGKLTTQCRKQVLRVAELQSDDYHLDRPLYYACRDAREIFCGQIHSGNGKVFECLYKHKSEDNMPKPCKKMLTIRQQLIAEDVKVERTFYSACKKDMMDHGCLSRHANEESDSKRSAVLLCLENVLKRDVRLDPGCLEEMTQLRRTLMEDYKITPDIVAHCDHEIQQFCKGGLERGGKTLHCLMRLANPNKRKKERELTSECKASLDDLLTEADIGQNYKVDKVLMEACAEVLDKDCKHAPANGMINCLMEKVDSDSMTDECEDHLLEIQYFLVRDFKLDPQLYKECHADAQKLCSASENWIEIDKPSASNDPLVFPCLYRHMKESQRDLKRDCVHEIKRVMRRRAKRIDLEPKIEDKCLADLGAFCSDLEKYDKGEEMACLQDHLESLAEDCEEAVREFTEDEDEDLDLDTKLMRACTPMIKKFCGELLEHDADANDVMDCLIENKHHHEMDKKCAAGVEHHQIIQLKDIRFSHKFREQCKSDIQTHCGEPGLKNKTQIVACLSGIVREDVLSPKKAGQTDKQHQRISESCRQQLRVEVLRRGETIELDPELKSKCEENIKNLCGTVEAGNAKVIQCLKDNKPKLSNPCHMLIFKRQQEEAVLGADYLLFRVCKPMIKSHCKSVDDAEDVMDCLKRNRNMDGFDSKCRALLMKKILQETKDYRLNPSLAKNCKLDIRKFCSKIIDERGTSDQEFEGAVVNCLKLQFAKKMLSRDCTTEIRSLVKESHLDIEMDPVLMHKCTQEIRQYCQDEIEEHEMSKGARLKFQPQSTGDKVEECLQRKLSDQKIPRASECGREISRIIEESHIDVNVDPQLRTACQKDLARWCQDLDSGEGRKMSCLLGALEDFPDKLTVYCKDILSKRLALWEYAAKAAPAESISDLADNVFQSPAKSYLMAVLMTIIGVIFIVGITCGRVTKRVTKESKNK